MFTIKVCSGDSKTADRGLTRETVLDEEEEEAEGRRRTALLRAEIYHERRAEARELEGKN